MEKRFTTNGYYIYDHFKGNEWLVNEVEAEEIVEIMNNLDMKTRERSKALSKLQKENEQLKQELQEFKEWEKWVGDVKREEVDRVFKMSIYEIAEAFEYYKNKIKELKGDEE